MDEVIEKKRFLGAILPKTNPLQTIQITGARQTGKTIISKYLNIPEPESGRSNNMYELFPLTLAEIYADKNRPLRFPLIDRILVGGNLNNIFNTLPLLSDEEVFSRKEAQAYILTYGGFPVLLHMNEKARIQWLRNYEKNYLDYNFSKLIHSATLLNYSELARSATISVDTARRNIEFLRKSYQIELIQPYYRDLTSRVVRTPKIVWLDVGIFRGHFLYESFVMTEIIKWIRTARRNIKYYFYRTRSGLEVDLLLELPNGILGIEIKSRNTVYSKDITPMKELAEILKTEWLGGLVIYNGDEIKKMGEPNIWALPSWRIFI